ncbi:MAG: nucleotidyltransferase domain-containing protein [Bacteroidetes bacterium]|nr:nucleotidyltransferase domain-containing protein [Bacteroidota bacterium]
MIESNLDKINYLCTKHKVEKLFAFGSILTDRFQTESDIDLVVNFSGVEL